MIIFLRHGQAENNTKKILAGRPPGINLTEDGKKQAEQAGEMIKSLKADLSEYADEVRVDVLGNVVLNETSFNQTKKIDVSNFRNGIYFVKVESEGSKAITRKVVVRH